MNLFEKRNPLATFTKERRQKFNCINCPGNKDRKKAFTNPVIPSNAEVLFVLPSHKMSALRKRVRDITDKNTCFIPDVLCRHSLTDMDDISVRNLHCSPLLSELIDGSNIKHVFLVGQGAMQAFFGDGYCDDVSYTRCRGYSMPLLSKRIWLSFVCEPSMDALVDGGRDYERLELLVFRQDIQNGMKHNGREIPQDWSNATDMCTPVEDVEAIDRMVDILDGRYEWFVSFDYETTGLKPFMNGHRIASCGICPNERSAFAFILNDRTRPTLRAILASNHIPKVAANNPFEYKWSHAEGGIPVNNLIYDCCLGAHLMDQRQGVSSVKFQARMRYGITGYDKAIDKYLKPTDVETDRFGANAINTVMSAPKQTLLLYNAIDALLEYWIARDSMNELGFV